MKKNYDILLDGPSGGGTIQKTKANNQVNVIYPKRNKYGVWSFDDDDLGIVGEPFVGDINVMIDMYSNGKKS